MARLVSDEAWGVLTVYGEARGEPYEGKVAVAEVILTRTRTRYQSDGSVVGTVLRPYQFSTWNSKDPNRRVAALIDDTDPVVADCVRAWQEAVAGSTYARSAVLYYDPDIVAGTPAWVASCHEVAVIGRQHFYALD